MRASLLLAVVSLLLFSNVSRADDPSKPTEPAKQPPAAKKADAPKKEKPAKPKESKKDKKAEEAKPATDAKEPTDEAKKSNTPKTEAPKKDTPPKLAAPKKPEPAKKAVTDISEVDADYWVQGEYYGTLASGPVGMHVIALGGDKFEAVEFSGGLPAFGWSPGMAKTKLKGKREGEVVKLKGEQHDISIANGIATITGREAHALGSLQRVERQSNTMGAAPPSGAIVLFDGSAPAEFTSANVTSDHLLKPGATTKMPVGDFRMHLEFRTPYKAGGRGQDRGNSGVYIQGRYEMQILDSFGLDGAFNECGSIYRQRAPDMNMSYAPLVWQTYDIWFRAARFDSTGKKVQNARVTLWHNGVAVHKNVEITAKTGAGKAEGPEALPILLQDHGNPVTFRNLWLVPGDGPGDECCTTRRGRFRRG